MTTRTPPWYTGPHAGANNRQPKFNAKKRKAPERSFQIALVKVLRAHALIPQECWWAVESGYKHLFTATKHQAQGCKRGVPDLHFVLPGGRIAFLELKAPKGSLSTEQKSFRDAALAAGGFWEYARTIDQAYGILAAWNVLPRSFSQTTTPTTPAIQTNQAA